MMNFFARRLLHVQWTQRSLKNTKEQNYVPRYNGYMNSGREMV